MVPRVKTSHLQSNPSSFEGSTSSDTEDLYLTQYAFQRAAACWRSNCLSCRLFLPTSLRWSYFLPSPLSFVYDIKPKLNTIHWDYDCIQPLQAPSSKGSEKKLRHQESLPYKQGAADTLTKMTHYWNIHVRNPRAAYVIYMCLYTGQLHGTKVVHQPLFNLWYFSTSDYITAWQT